MSAQSAQLWLKHETSSGRRRCVSLRARDVSEAVFNAWLQDRCAAWSKHWPVQHTEPARLVNGEWCCIVDLTSERLLDLKELLTMDA